MIGPGTRMVHEDGAVVVIDRRKESDDGWWNTDGSGFSDRVIEETIAGKSGWVADAPSDTEAIECPTCQGDETVRCEDPHCEPDDGDRHEHYIECPDAWHRTEGET